MFRPVPLIWVEVLVEREATARILEELAAARAIELERALTEELSFMLLPEETLRARLQELENLRHRYAGFLPAPDPADLAPALRNARPAVALAAVAASFTAWAQAAQPLVETLRRVDTEREELAFLDSCLAALPAALIDLAYLGAGRAPEPRRYIAFIARGGRDAWRGLTVAVLAQAYPVREKGKDGSVLLGLAETASLAEVERSLHARGMRFARVPGWLAGTPRTARHRVGERLAAANGEWRDVYTQLAVLNRRMRCAGHLWLLLRLRWLSDALAQTWRGRHFVWITGWVPPHRLADVRLRLDRIAAPYLLRALPDADVGPAPVVLVNPAWMQRFEIFVRGFGTPSRNEVDPSPVLAFVAPLMFGYMFGDVGHGAVLVLVGWLLRRRYPVLGLFVPAGLLAMVFGFVFGSIFSYEHLFAPWWLHPMDDPLRVLIPPLAFGAGLILAGMVFDGVRARWSGTGRAWWAERLPMILLYCALPLLVVRPAAGMAVAGLGLLWMFAGVGRHGFAAGGIDGMLSASGRSAAELIEGVFQLVINTLSFARIGAFALAHTGLCAAVIALAQLPDNPVARAVILVFGNVLAIALEGLIVSIQTTRLIMFEFFRRFLRAEGRPFRPLVPPETAASTA